MLPFLGEIKGVGRGFDDGFVRRPWLPVPAISAHLPRLADRLLDGVSWDPAILVTDTRCRHSPSVIAIVIVVIVFGC
jgi:hypothetical protein